MDELTEYKHAHNYWEAEAKRLRAELAQVREILGDREARIAELEAAGNRLGDAAITGILDGSDALARADRAEARITEFEARLQRQYAILLEHKYRAEKAEADCKRTEARIAELEEKVTEWRVQSSIYEKRAEAAKDPAGAVDRAERAEAELTPLKIKLAGAEAQRDGLQAFVDRALLEKERAEAELDISREAHRMVQSALLSQAAETVRAEDERDALREALRKIEQETIDHVAVRIARSALNTPP